MLGCDYGFHMTIDDWNEGIEGELDDMFAAGITSFKMYLTYPAMMIGDGAVYSALKALKKRGGIAGVHCENAGVIDARIAELKAAGRACGRFRPPRGEARLSRGRGGRAAAAHRRGGGRAGGHRPPDQPRGARRGRLCPRPRAEGLCRDLPAVPCPRRRRVLRRQLVHGRALCLRAAHPRRGKSARALARSAPRRDPDHLHRPLLASPSRRRTLGREDFTKIPGGLPGVETRGEVVYTRGVAAGRMTVAGMCRALCENPAKLYGSIPARASSPRAPTRTSWSTIPGPATSSPRATWSQRPATPL
ncbi:MAG: hypothetical protein ACLSHJ_09100 [Oscillospiraceae bacterium]